MGGDVLHVGRSGTGGDVGEGDEPINLNISALYFYISGAMIPIIYIIDL